MRGSPVSVQIDFERAAAPVTGSVRTAEDELAFAGWADLFALLRAIVATDPSHLANFDSVQTEE
jgi:hypothetical protein